MNGWGRKATVALAILVIAAAAGYLVSRLFRGDDKMAVDRAWKCTQCGHVFEKEFEPDPYAIPGLAKDGSIGLEEEKCPKCGGAAHQYITMVCSKCGEEFRHLEQLDPNTHEPKRPACPKCKSTAVSPRAPSQ